MRKLLILLAVCIATPIFAQTNIGIDYYLLGEYGNARKYFESKLSSNAAEANFYLGEIAFAEGDMAKAAEFYNKCTAADPGNPLCLIAQAKMKLKSDPKAAEAALEAVAKANKNNLDIALTIGRAYLDNNMKDKAMSKVADARKINSKAPEVYILEGDIVAAGEDASKIGDAAGKYEMSNYFDPNYRLGYMKTAQVYETNNPGLAIEKLKAVIEKYPDYTPAYGLLAKIHTQRGFYPSAIEIYKAHSPSTPDDIERYARALYFTDNFDEAQIMVTKGLQADPNNFILNRYQLYIYAKTGNYTQGIKLAENFFSLAESSRYIPMDYTAYATLLKDAKRYDEAIAQFNQAIKIDPDTPERYKEASEMAKEIKNLGMAADYYKTYIDKKTQAAGAGYPDELLDINTLGSNYYTAGTSISKNPELAAGLMKNSVLIGELLASGNGFNADSLASSLEYFTASYSKYYLKKASATFSTIIERAPESYIGYRFKALSEHALNPDVKNSSAAKGYYEKMVEVITAKDDWRTTPSMQRMALEGYNYLAYYYYLTGDAPQAIQYANKVLELDPENSNAKAILADLNK